MCACLRKKGINKNNFCYISPICPEDLSGWICTKFSIGSPLADVINCAEFFFDWFMGIDFVGVKICLSPYELKVAVNSLNL